jgi:hypothetical protein
MPDSATPSDPKTPALIPAQDAAVTLDPATSFGEGLRLFWARNGNAIYVLCALVLVGILAKGAWDYFAAQKQMQIGAEYAAASTPEALKRFAGEHADDPLAGVADLRIADGAYAAGKPAEAIPAYQSAVSALPAGPLAARARLGLALCEVQAGRSGEGEAALRQLASDPTQLKGVRTEAAYQLASLAAAAGRADDVRKWAEQLIQIDPSSPWTQRAFALQSSVAAAAAPTPAPVPTAAPAAVQPTVRPASGAPAAR